MADAKKSLDPQDIVLTFADFTRAKEEVAKKAPPPAAQQKQPQQQPQAHPVAAGPQNPLPPQKSETLPVFEHGPSEIQPDEIKYLEKIGGGCFGEVFRGKCRGIEVAVKKLTKQDLDEKTLSDFKKEVEIMAKLNHPNVVLYLGACCLPGHMAMVTEIMPKGNVAQLLHNPAIEISLAARMRMAKDAALGMTWLHESNPCILHRDMKPQNLLIDKNMTVKVCDFGLSVIKPRGEVLRDKDSIPGTPLWMAPEVLTGKDVDEKSDVYSYGIVLWEILTREEPFSHHDDYVTFKRAVCIKNERPPIPDNCLPSLRYLIEACWQKESAKRPSFRQILPLLDIVIIDATIQDDAGRELWHKEFLGKDEVKWEDFVNKLCKSLSLPQIDHQDIKIKCLKAVLAEQSKDPTQSNQFFVAMDKFGKLCEVYGPLFSPSGYNILKKVHEIIQNEWFHGEISREEAERRLSQAPNGTYLVRLSTTDGRCFTISKMSRNGKINHQRINYKYVNDEDQYSISVHKKQNAIKVSSRGSLKKFMDKVSNDLYLKSVCPGSQYRHLFVAKPDLDGINGYVIDDEDYESDD